MARKRGKHFRPGRPTIGRTSPWRAKEDIPPYFVPCRGRRPRRPARFVRHIRFFEELSPPFHRRGRAAVTPMGNTKKQPPDNANRHLFVTGRRGRRPLQTRVAFPPRLFVFRNKAQGWATDGRPHDFSCQNNSSSRRRRISLAVGIFHARSAFHPTIGRISPRHREVTPAPTPTNESSVSVSMVRFPKQSARVGNRWSSSRFFLTKTILSLAEGEFHLP